MIEGIKTILVMTHEVLERWRLVPIHSYEPTNLLKVASNVTDTAELKKNTS